MKTIIQIVGCAGPFECSFAGEYILSFDAYANENGLGVGELLTTPNPLDAKRFDNFKAAWEFWKQQSPTVPLRPDGQPNRPLTAFHVSLERFA